jgi:hypothetical protein
MFVSWKSDVTKDVHGFYLWVVTARILVGRCQFFLKNTLSPSSGFKMETACILRPWHLPTNVHGAEIQKIVIIIAITAVRPSTLI